MDSIIEDVQVRKILDSRGNPTVEVDVITWNGFGRAAAPSGASTGSREVVSFPEGGVDVIVSEIEDIIASELIGMDAEDIATIDEVLREVDGTDNLSAIGGNTTVAVSMAVAKAAAASYNMPLYKFLGGILCILLITIYIHFILLTPLSQLKMYVIKLSKCRLLKLP